MRRIPANLSDRSQFMFVLGIMSQYVRDNKETGSVHNNGILRVWLFLKDFDARVFSRLNFDAFRAIRRIPCGHPMFVSRTPHPLEGSYHDDMHGVILRRFRNRVSTMPVITESTAFLMDDMYDLV